MRNSYEVRAQKFIREIASYIENCEDWYELGKAVYNYMIDNPNRKVIVDSGMTRMVMITSDYVVKIEYDMDNVRRYGGGENEMAFYETAEREGMAHLFAKISRYVYNGHTYYIMPRIRGIREDRWYDATYYMTWQEEEWCDKHNLCDLHSKNYGFRNGKVCIVDYGCIVK